MIPNVVTGPAASSTKPPMAGPTARARLKLTPFSATASVRSARGTASTITVPQAGAFIALPVPSEKISPSSSHAVIWSAAVNSVSAAADNAIQV